MNRTLLLLGTTFLFGVLPLLAQGCGGQGGSAMSCCPATPEAAAPPGNHGDHSSAPAAPTAAAPTQVDGTAKIVFDNYLIIQRALADDSVKKVAASAEALAKAVRENSANPFPVEVAVQADALTKAKDLVAARTAFKPLSDLLIQYAKANKLAPGAYYEVYCPMAKAGWLQADKAVKNPYFGAAMLRCGTVKN